MTEREREREVGGERGRGGREERREAEREREGVNQSVSLQTVVTMAALVGVEGAPLLLSSSFTSAVV